MTNPTPAKKKKTSKTATEILGLMHQNEERFSRMAMIGDDIRRIANALEKIANREDEDFI